MKKNILILFVSAFFLNGFAQEKPVDFPFGAIDSKARGVFGDDNRVEIKDAEGFKEFARATAVMIPKNSIRGNRIYAYSLKGILERTFSVNKFHENVKFLDQPTAGNCTGFLIAPDVFVTAGHCVETIEDAQEYIYLFDYTSSLSFNEEENYFVFDSKNAFEAVEVLTSELSDATIDKKSIEDYAVIKLDRQSNRAPYRFRTSGSVKEKTNIYTIGAPSGLPLKFSEKAIVVDGEPKKWFKSSIDAFPGNSGGPVFDQNGFIEGILVRGAVQFANGRYTGDYKYDEDCECIKTVYFETVDYTAGCQTHRITEIPGYILVNSVYSNLKYAIENKLEKRFDQWNDYSWIFLSENLKGRERFEDIAIASKNYNALSTILEYTIDDLSNDKKREYLDIAFAQNDLELLTLFLKNGVYADIGDDEVTLLSKSVKTNNIDFVKTFLNYDANIEVKDTNGNTLLHICAEKGYLEIAELLIANGLKPDTKNNRKRLPEKTARKNGYRSLGEYLKRIRKRS
jgi:V8-like Glu-specific endopeptidase